MLNYHFLVGMPVTKRIDPELSFIKTKVVFRKNKGYISGFSIRTEYRLNLNEPNYIGLSMVFTIRKLPIAYLARYVYLDEHLQTHQEPPV